jgi:hypothetical protein
LLKSTLLAPLLDNATVVRADSPASDVGAATAAAAEGLVTGDKVNAIMALPFWCDRRGSAERRTPMVS